jgi:ribosomal-protein-alanine N-acetyltransferase
MSSKPPRPDIPALAAVSTVIETSRFTLRPLELADADALFELASNPDVARYMSWSAHQDRAETETFITGAISNRERDTDLTWAIVIDGKPAGCIGLGGIRWTFRAWRIDRAELGYWIGQPYWGQGYTSEAARVATTWAFETLGLHKLTIGCIEGNAASQRIIEKLGYRFLAKFEDDVWRDGRWWNHLRYELTAAEWADTTSTQRFVRRP